VRTFALLLLAVLALLTFTLHRAADRAGATPGDLRLSTIASELAKRKVTIRCEGTSGKLMRVDGESGLTLFVDGKPGKTSFLQEGVCDTLHGYSRETKSGFDCLLPCANPLEVAWSLNTLAHESYHLAGVRNEAETECYALQAIDFAARRLGATPEQARALSGFSFQELPERMPALYSSPQCRDGGRYDLRPGDPVWP
jgi:hypothetical protein